MSPFCLLLLLPPQGFAECCSPFPAVLEQTVPHRDMFVPRCCLFPFLALSTRLFWALERSASCSTPKMEA